VRATRRLFAQMESDQKELLKQLEVSPYDIRLRPCRQDAKDLFERMLSLSGAKSRGKDDVDAATLYVHCLIRVLKHHGLPVPDKTIQEDTRLDEQFRETKK
jgi:hypothetical protein